MAGAAMACEMVLCPPAPYLIAVADAVAGSPIGVGGQDCHAQAEGAHTGDIAATMLRDVGCSYVNVGHYERREDHGESDAAGRATGGAGRGAGAGPGIGDGG